MAILRSDQTAADVPSDVPAGIHLGRFCNLDKAIDRYGRELVELMGDHCLLADEVAYDALKEFKDPEANAGWRMFEQGLEHGVDSLEDPAPGLVKLFEDLDHVPDWVDFDQLRRGAIAFWRAGPLVPMVLGYSVIAKGFTSYSSSRPVLFSGRMTTRAQVGQRLLESFRYIARAYEPGGMERQAEGFKHTARVRMIHATVRHVLSRAPEWDWANWGIPINGFDAMDTQAGQFGVEVVDSLHKSGIRLSDQEREDIFALTRYGGWVMGVSPEILHTDEEDARIKHGLHDLVEHPADDANRQIIKGVIDYGCEESFGGYDILPGPVAKVMTVERRKKLSYGMMWAWQPEEIMAQVGVPKDNWRFVLPAARPFIWLGDRVTRLSADRDVHRAQKVLDEFEVAIEMREGELHALAEPEQLAKDVDAGAKQVADMVGG